ncbi:hypothetical protein [Paenibacillus sp. FSL E2-0178]
MEKEHLIVLNQTISGQQLEKVHLFGPHPRLEAESRELDAVFPLNKRMHG